MLVVIHLNEGTSWSFTLSISVTQHRERMLQDGALLCFKGINKGDMSNFRLISDKHLVCQLFVQNLVKILKTFHFVQKCTHLESQWNVLFSYVPHIYKQFGCHGNWNF